ncbi:MAG: histidinol phosphate phosphatase domain-containing protein [Candidatus Omnitrophica bacterium]|nr:histidinol phosphate phosphatase domain-containing protein [Candidatus Omnitrophota bacterium]
MIDLHTHTLLSDGDLLPSELARRAEEKGYGVIGMTDHADFSNYENVIKSLCRAASHINETMRIKMIPGVEITHVNPREIPDLARMARQAGAKIVVVHGETIVEPVEKGTNRKALESDIDILAHPGMLDKQDAKTAAERKISIEISGRAGHSFSNGHIARLWYEYGFPLVLNTDTHSPENLVDEKFAAELIISAGVKPEDVQKVRDNSAALAEKLLVK